MSLATKGDRERGPGGGAGFRRQGELLWRDFPELAQDVRRWLDVEGVCGAHRRKAFSTFVEMTYNVLHHAAPAAHTEADGLRGRRVSATVALGIEGREVWVATENLVDPERAVALAERLAQLAILDPGQVKLLYRGRVADGTSEPDPSAGNTAGLGLLTIARDVTRPLEHALAPGRALGELTTFFLKAYV
jgi:hypothetical protein